MRLTVAVDRLFVVGCRYCENLVVLGTQYAQPNHPFS